MKFNLKVVILGLWLLTPPSFSFGQSASWTDSGELVQSLFQSSYRNAGGQSVAILGSDFLQNSGDLDVRIFLGFDRGPSCDGLSFSSVAAWVERDTQSTTHGHCEIVWMSVLGSESKIQIDSNVLLENGWVITNPILGLFFLDYGTLDVAPIFLLDERSTRVNAMDLIADASDATGRDFSSANLQEVIFAHHRQEWIEHDRPTLDELREHVQASLHALFGSPDQQSIAEKK